jgi:signal transduction histidine kinase
MLVFKHIVLYLLLLLLPFFGFTYNYDLKKNIFALDVYNQKLQKDSTSIAKLIDSARFSFENQNYHETILYAEKAYEYLKKYPLEDYSVESMLLLARAYQNLHGKYGEESDFNNTIKYYLKTITFLESAESKFLLPRIYKEYGDFYAKLHLPRLTINNYMKAHEIIKNGYDEGFKEELLIEIAKLHYRLDDIESAIKSYNALAQFYFKSEVSESYFKTLENLSGLYRAASDYDNSLRCAKEVLMHYQETGEVNPQIIWYNQIGEISFEAGNNYQAKNAFVNYFDLVNKDSLTLQREIASLRYVETLISVGEIYKQSTDNGYLSDYELAIRHLNRAYDLIQPEKNPQISSVILNRIGKIYFNKKDYKTCVTYFNLALHYAKKQRDLAFISDNYIMLARAYDEVDKWEEAAEHYELNAEYKDSLMIEQEEHRRAVDERIINQRADNMRVEETLDRIEARERQQLTLAEKELRNVSLERELEIYKRDIDLKEALIANQKLVEDSVKRNLALTVQQIENIRNQQKIESLRSQQEIQEQRLKNQEVDRENKRQQIKILEQENSLAKSQQAYYVLSIILISLVLIFIIVVYIQKRRANSILKNQNRKIELQSSKLKQAYKNLELLSTIGRDITSSLIIEEIIKTIYANINTLMDASVLGIGVFDKQTDQMVFPGVIERGERLTNINIGLDSKDTLASWCFLNQKEIIIRNYYREYNGYINPEEKPYPGDGNSTSIIYLPLTIGPNRLGVLTVQSFSENAFNDYHINIVRNIAIYTKIALENANFYKQLEEKSKSLIEANKSIKEQHELIEEQYQQLLNINEEKNNLMRILAHDLRNPLATAMSMTELVRFEKENLSAEQYQASEIIWRGLNRMNEMIRKILDIKAAETQKILLDWDQVNVNEIIAGLENALKLSAEHKHIRLQIITESDDPYVKVDRNYFNQIIENLVSNAIKFSQTNTNIYIITSEVKDKVRIEVRDEGPGIPSEEMSQLFKKYHKLSIKPTAGEQSIGLGLSIVKKYVEVMNGKVWCESQVGTGTSFILEFNKEVVPVS